MVALMHEAEGPCITCGADPCMDGTACTGQRRRVGEIVLMVGGSLGSAVASAIEHAQFQRSVELAMRSPKYWNSTPRSPKPRFRKGRK